MKRFHLRLLYLFLFTASSGVAQERLIVTPHAVINLSARGDAWLLFDDQRLTETYGCEIPQTDNQWRFFDATWNWRTFFYPVEVLVDFETLQPLNKVCLRKGGGVNATGKLKVYVGDPLNWELLLEHTVGSAECYELDTITTRYVKFRFESTAAKIREIELYAPERNRPNCGPQLDSILPSTTCGTSRLYMEEFIGSNTNVDIPPAKAMAVGFVRNYHGIFMTEGYDDPTYPGYPNNQYNWRPEFELEQFDYDFFYQGFQDIGLEVVNSIHRSPPYLTTFAYKTGDLSFTAASPLKAGYISIGQFIKSTERKPFSEKFHPIIYNKAYDDPNMYLEYADIMYQFSGRYGNNPIVRNIKTASNSPAFTGLGTVQYLENWNEPDKWWHFFSVEGLDYLDPYVEEQLGYFSPFEYAAMSSATFDGHGKTNGVEHIVQNRYPNGHPSQAGPVGMRAADPNMKFVMAGLSELNTDYVRSMQFWFQHHRPDISFPFYAINFHDYSNDGIDSPLGNHALSPEADGLKEKLEKVVDSRNRYLPGVEVWLSEFGYDSHPHSIQSADCTLFCTDCDSPACKATFREIQAQWIVRSFLEIAAAGIDRAMVFNMRDGSAETSSLYQTSGLTTFRGDGFQNKPSWYYIATMKQALKGTKFDPSFQHPDKRVRLYRFKSDCDSLATKTVYAIWSPTSATGSDSILLEQYPIAIPAEKAYLIKPKIGDFDGERTLLYPTTAGTFQIHVSERPQFIVVGELPPDTENCACNYIDFTASGAANAASLVDEQNKLGGLLCVEGREMSTQWQAKAQDEAILDFGRYYDLSSIFLHGDTLAAGKVAIYHGTPDNWQLYKLWDTRNVTPYRWKVFHDCNINTRYIRLQTLSDSTFINEIAFCGTVAPSSCSDGILNGDELKIDCGGSCNPCFSKDTLKQVAIYEPPQPPVASQLLTSLQPNPSKAAATLTYQLHTESTITISLWNTAGQRLKELLQTNQAEGKYELRLESPQEAGLYWIKIQTDSEQQVLKWLIL